MPAHLVHLELARGGEWLAGISDAVEAAFAQRDRLPAAQAHIVELAVAWIESGAHYRRSELERQSHRCALHLRANFLPHHEEERAPAVAGVQQLALERAELVARHPDLRTSGIVPCEREPKQWFVWCRIGAEMRIGTKQRHAAAGLDPVQRAHRHPRPLVVT